MGINACRWTAAAIVIWIIIIANILIIQGERTTNLGFAWTVVYVLGSTLILTIIAFTTCVVRLRRKLRSIATLVQLNAGANETTASNSHMTEPVSRGVTAPSSSAGDMVLYEDAERKVRRENTDSYGYLEPLPVYMEITDQSPPIDGEDDKGYVALL